jgi:hypothetical protein
MLCTLPGALDENDKPESRQWWMSSSQLYETPETEASVQAIIRRLDVKRAHLNLFWGIGYWGLRLEQDHLAQVAGLPGVVNIEPLPTIYSHR